MILTEIRQDLPILAEIFVSKTWECFDKIKVAARTHNYGVVRQHMLLKKAPEQGVLRF